MLSNLFAEAAAASHAVSDGKRDRVCDASYTFASLMFIFALAGLAKQSSAKKGNVYGMIGV